MSETELLLVPSGGISPERDVPALTASLDDLEVSRGACYPHIGNPLGNPKSSLTERSWL